MFFLTTLLLVSLMYWMSTNLNSVSPSLIAVMLLNLYIISALHSVVV